MRQLSHNSDSVFLRLKLMSINKNKPSPTELIILKSLWKESPLSAREIHQRIIQSLTWSYSSTRKTLDRMQDKKYLRIEDSHGIKVFFPISSKVKTMAYFVSDFASRILEIDEPLPVSMFADSSLLDENELKELEELLNTKLKIDE